MNKVIDILGNIGPMIVIISVGVGIVTISRNYETFLSANQIISNLNVTKAVSNYETFLSANQIISNLNVTKAVDSWWMTSVIYSGLNLIIATTFLVGVGSTAKNRKTCIWGGVLGGAIFMIAAMALNLGIMSDIENIYIKEIPTLYMAEKIGPITGMMFSIMLIAGIYTTAVPLLWSVCTSFSEEKSSKFTIIAIVCTILGIIAGRLPFAMLVKFIYPVSGLFGVIIIGAIFIKRIKINKSGINLKNKRL